MMKGMQEVLNNNNYRKWRFWMGIIITVAITIFLSLVMYFFGEVKLGVGYGRVLFVATYVSITIGAFFTTWRFSVLKSLLLGGSLICMLAIYLSRT